MGLEKLIVRNFGPIKNVELDLGRVTILIGEQASGKSVLSKLIAIAKDRRLLTECLIEDFVTVHLFASKYLFEDYQIHNFFSTDTYIEYQFDTFKIIWKGFEQKQFEATDKITKEQISNLKKILLESSNKDLKQQIKEGILLDPYFINNAEFTTTNRDVIYIPTERLIFSLIQGEGLYSLLNNNISIPKCITYFGNKHALARRAIRKMTVSFLGIEYNFDSQVDTVKGEHYAITMLEASSGLQTMMPLLVTMEYYVKLDTLRGVAFIIEEPELNLYPKTQYNLVKELVSYYNQNDRNKIILTTHSPYILTALNNSIQAKNVVKADANLKDKVDKILPSQYHLDYDDVKTYYIKDGKAKLIMNEEFQTIDANSLDDVSDEISGIFDELLDLKYS